MSLFLFIQLLTVVLASAIPHTELQTRQTWTGLISNELWQFGCREIILVFARETLAPGNMGATVGPPLSNGLKVIFGDNNVSTQGVNYDGQIWTNFDPGGGPPNGIVEMQYSLTAATTLCPNSIIVASGYSQGAAITHRAIESLPQAVKDRITAVVTFGDTQTLQDGGRIRGFPTDRTLIICNVGDVVCTGTLWVFPVHMDYIRRVPEALTFLVTKIVQAGVPVATRTG